MQISQWNENSEIKLFQEYLQIPSVHPNINYEPCIEFLQNTIKDLDLQTQIIYPVNPATPILIITWQGIRPELPSILLNSHMDVVPANANDWTYPPFNAHMEQNGNIYGRGAQDMKCVTMQYLAGIRMLKKDKIRLMRTVHVLCVPDEEIGGENGMKALLKTDVFTRLNIGFALDEGYASANNEYFVFYGERTSWVPRFTCTGTDGHGSLLHDNTAAEKINFIINKYMEYRAKQKTLLNNNQNFTIGDVTSINLTKINGGLLDNVVPSTISIVFDVRIALTDDEKEIEQMLRCWCKEAGENIEMDFIVKHPRIEPSKCNETNPFWMAFKTFFNDENQSIKPLICPARGDTCFLREIGIQALGFSPMKNMECRMHGIDEYLNADVYLKGIIIYKNLITKLANVLQD